MSGRGVGPRAPPGWRLRARAVLADRLSVVLAACLLLAAVGGVVTYGAVVAPGTTTETRSVGSWQTTAGFDHHATVTAENPVFPVGTALENRSAYFPRVAPVLQGVLRAGYRASSGDVRTQTTLTLVLRAAEEGTTYWRVTESLGERSATLAPGERLAVPFSLNVTALRHRLDRIQGSLGSPGDTAVLLRARTRFRGTVEGHAVNRTVTRTLALDPGRQLYRVSTDGRATATHRWTRTVEVPRDPGPLQTLGGPLLLLVGLLGTAGGIQAEREGLLRLSTRERARLERAEFEEWVTVATVPENPPGDRVRVASLEGLVDLAADTDARILQDPRREHYVVLAGDVHYWYDPERREAL